MYKKVKCELKNIVNLNEFKQGYLLANSNGRYLVYLPKDNKVFSTNCLIICNLKDGIYTHKIESVNDNNFINLDRNCDFSIILDKLIIDDEEKQLYLKLKAKYGDLC